MNIKVLAIGDITGKSGLDFLCKKLNEIKTEYDISFTVVNSENSAGLGMKPAAFFWVMRIAITGAASTPGGATELSELFGKKAVLGRLKYSLKRLN